MCPPKPQFLQQCPPDARAAIQDFLGEAVIGGPDTVEQGLLAMADATLADELMLVCDIYDPALRLRSLDIAAHAMRQAAEDSAKVRDAAPAMG